MNILGISGSLRTGSSNTALLHAAARLAPEGMKVEIAAPIDRVPHFNPDIDGDDSPAAVRRWRSEVREADGILICSPEYAQGVPGVLKNALDWLVSSGDLENKPLALINASPNYLGASQAQASLILILSTMGANVLEGATISVASVRGKLSANGEIIDAETKRAFATGLGVMAAVIADRAPAIE